MLYPVKTSRLFTKISAWGTTATVQAHDGNACQVHDWAGCLQVPKHGHAQSSRGQGEGRQCSSSPWGQGSTSPGKPGPLLKQGQNACDVHACMPSGELDPGAQSGFPLFSLHSWVLPTGDKLTTSDTPVLHSNTLVTSLERKPLFYDESSKAPPG